jgi:hypothetical protein
MDVMVLATACADLVDWVDCLMFSQPVMDSASAATIGSNASFESLFTVLPPDAVFHTIRSIETALRGSGLVRRDT